MPETRIEVSCDDCKEDANVCLCALHYDERLAEEYERGVEDGKITGRDEAEEEAKEADKE